MPLDLPERPLLFLLSFWLFLYAPGLALLRRCPGTVSASFVRVLVSVTTTTLTATSLAIAEVFSLPALLATNLAVTILFLAAGTSLGRREVEAASSASDGSLRPGKDVVGPLIVVAALAAYWPAYPTFLGTSDSTVYVSTGISLARHGTLARDDELGPSLPLRVRELLFDSMSQVFGDTGPPYRRMPGGIMIESLDATRAWPCFFPVPSVWSAIFVAAGAPGHDRPEEAAPDYAPVFAALALWAFWHLARGWLGAAWGLTAVVLLAGSGAFYGAARMPLSEPVAAYFALSALALMASWRRASPAAVSSDVGPDRVAAMVAGAAMGAAVLVRVEIALLVALAFAAMPRSGPARAGRLPTAFVAAFLAMTGLAVVQALLLPGTYVSPLLDHLGNVRIRYLLTYGPPSAALLGAVGLGGLAALGLGTRLFGLSATLRWSFVAAVLGGHWGASNFLVERTPMWLSFYVGWAGLALAATGAFLAWRQRDLLPAGPFVLALAAATAAILFYNPHVYPALPWGARRFVPLLLPLLLLLACHASARAAARSRLLGLACAAALVFGTVQGGRPVWGKALLEGAWEQLEAIAAAVPGEGTLLVDRDVSSMMVAPALWLVHDRNSVTIPPTLSSSRSQRELPGLVWFLAPRGPVHLLTRGVGMPLPVPKVKMTLVTRVTAGLRFMEQTYDRPPENTERYLMPMAVYRLERSLDPRGSVTR